MTRKQSISSATIALWVAFAAMPAGCFHPPQQPAAVMLPPVGSVPSELCKITLPTYRIESPDILLIDVNLPPKEVLDLPVALWPQAINGQHLVRIDGTVGLGIWGSVPVAGLTMDEAAAAIRQHVYDRIKSNPTIKGGLDEANKDKAPKIGKDGKEIKSPSIQLIDSPDKLLVIVDVYAYNSKTYTIITDGAGYGEQIYSFPITGNDTVLQALSNINGIPFVSSKRNMWLARRTPQANTEQILPIDYVGMTQHGIAQTNYQVMPGDRIYVRAEGIFKTSNFLTKYLNPIEQVLGIGLLGGNTVNSFKSTNGSTGQ